MKWYVLLISIFFSIIHSHALADFQSNFGVPVSLSLGAGSLKSDDLNLDSRVMNAVSLEALPGYRLGQWHFGLHLDYRSQGQITPISEAGGTNLKGQGYLIGLGARYDFNERLYTQGAVDLYGHYDLEKNTSSGQNDHLEEPLGVSLKAGYAFFESVPKLTFDAGLQYLTYKKIHIAGNDQLATSEQLMVSVGITYFFGSRSQSNEHNREQVPPEMEIVDNSHSMQNKELAKIKGVQKVGSLFMLSLESASFDSGSAQLNEETKKHFAKAAKTFAKSNRRLRVEGHTDSSGSTIQNQQLSLARADAVKAYLIENGVNPDLITTQGLGSSKPLVDNGSPEGRTQNRRVEVYLESKRGE